MTQPAVVNAFRGGPGLIRVVGHRGARGILPENTMIGFEFAISTGAHLLEFDVVITADCVPVITHNHHLHAPTFREQTGAFLTTEPKVADVTWDELQTYDVGRIDGATAYGRRFPDQAQIDGLRVPSLRELLECTADPRFADAQFMLEIKSDPDHAQSGSHRQKLVNTVLEVVYETGAEQRTLLHSFDWGLLAECQRQAPDIPTSFLTQLPKNPSDIGEASSLSVCPDFTNIEGQIPTLVAKAGGALWCPYVHDVTKDAVVQAHDLGLVVAVWTVNELEDIDRMIALGVDAIVSDYPGRIQRRLSDHNLRWS